MLEGRRMEGREGWKERKWEGQIYFTLYVSLLIFSANANAQLQRLFTPGKLAFPHAKYEEDCKQCHDAWQGITSEKCLKCHDRLEQQIQTGMGLHEKLKSSQNGNPPNPPLKRGAGGIYRWKPIQNRQGDCAVCHLDHQGRQFSIISQNQFAPPRFQHDVRGFNLIGKHAGVKCEGCHSAPTKSGFGKTYLGLKSDCFSCHQKDDAARGHQGRLGNDCASCHNENGWKPSTFDRQRHNELAFVLMDEHADVACVKCHAENRFRGIDRACFACHQKDDIHKGQLGKTCESCHITKGFKLSTFDRHRHNTLNFKLLGKHATVDCAKCHVGGQYKNLGSTCFDCHAETDRTIGHQGQFGQPFASLKGKLRGCESCHTVNGWRETTFTRERHQQIAFKLGGKHWDVACVKCHVNRRYREMGSTCFDCHAGTDQTIGHRGQLGSEAGCESCHTVNGWSETSFTREGHQAFEFKLEGKHWEVACEKCHVDGQYKNLSSRCFDCHRPIDLNTGHRGNLGEACEDCHTAEEWKHSTFTRQRHEQLEFKLPGKHADAECVKCHVNSQKYRGIGTRCIDCHG